MLRLGLLILSLVVSAPIAFAQARVSDVVDLVVLEGGRNADGTYLAALRIELKEGWKTYWRAPGDAGIPPRFSWRGSRNIGAVEVIWPAPVVFDQSGYQSIGYKHHLVLPLRITPERPDTPVRLKGVMDLGVCDDICVPARLPFVMALDPDAGRNAAIAAALAQRPFSAKEAGVRSATCRVAPSPDGMRVEMRIDLPSGPGTETVVLEPANPHLWASQMQSKRKGRVLVAVGELMHEDGRSFALDRSKLRITVLRKGQAVEINGCTPA